MIKKILFYMMVTFSILFLFVSSSPFLEDTSFVYYALSGVSFLIVLTFFYHFQKVFRRTLSNQLNLMAEKNSLNWSSWVSDNINEFTTIILVISPYILGLAAISSGLTIWSSKLEFMPKISITLISIHIIVMLFLLITLFYNWISNIGRQNSHQL